MKQSLEKSADVIDYIAFMINEFSEEHKLSVKQSFDYLYDYGGIKFLDDFYDVEHCENPIITLGSLKEISLRHGGAAL